MSEAKPVNTCSVSKDSMVSLDHEDTYLELVIKKEEVDLKPDCIKCETDEDTDNSNVLVDNEMTDGTYNEDIKERRGLVTNMDGHTNMGTSKISPHYNDESQMYIEISGVKLEVKKNDEISANEIPEDLNTEINVKQIHKSDTDITVGEEVRHTDNININSKSESQIIKPNAQNGKGLQSDICNNSFTPARCLRRHASIKHPSTIKVCTKKNLTTHTGEKPFSCKSCEYRCVKKRDLTIHTRTHTGERPFSCDICGFKFTVKQHLTRHLRTHTGERPFSCDICTYRCAQKCQLKCHMLTHTGTKPFSCDICSYKSAHKSHLKRHIGAHTGIKPLSCDKCNYKSAQKGDLKRHLRTHTNTTSLSCNICCYKSAHNGHFQRHLRTHTDTNACDELVN